MYYIAFFTNFIWRLGLHEQTLIRIKPEKSCKSKVHLLPRSSKSKIIGYNFAREARFFVELIYQMKS